MNKFIPKTYEKKKLRKKLKYTKRSEFKHIDLKIGSIGLKTLESGSISADVLESIRRTISRRIKKIGKMIIYLHANKPLTRKSSGMRMGKGAGSLYKWVTIVKKGKILVELVGVPENIGIITLRSVQYKLPVKTLIIKKN